MTHTCGNELGHHWFSWWLVTCSVPNHYLDQWWLITMCDFKKNGRYLHWAYVYWKGLNSDFLIEAEWRIYASGTRPSLDELLACCFFGAQPSSQPMLICYQLDIQEKNLKFESKFNNFLSRISISKCRLQKWRPSFSVSTCKPRFPII